MEPTQESTQPCTDPRRMGQGNSGLLDQDVSDLICILHPNSLAAHEAVAATAAIAPQHILQRDELEYEYSDTSALDLALRMSSDVHDLGVGFAFGRSKSRCDILLADDHAKRISNTHFRIYLTGDGIIMLQDTSTNGTLVDNHRLQKRQKDNSRMLTSGSVIEVVSGNQVSDDVKFIVRVPSREGFAIQYTENMMKYLQRIQRHEEGAAKPNTRQSSQPLLPWSVANAYGMHWTGGTMYNVTGQIGKGAFATVYKVATKQHGTVYAAKELDKRRFMKNGILDQKVDNEMTIMRDLKHPNIVQYVDHHEHDRWIYIIMEYVPGGELSTYLQSHGRIPEDMVKCVARQILHALHYLHKRKITHRDIKPDNILISSLDPLRVKLSDFGLSKVVQEETFLKTFCGTLLYCAPEVYPEYETYRRGEARKRRRLGDPPPKTSPYNQSVDMWSLGAVLYHILAGTPPFMPRPEERGPQMLRVLMTSDVDYNPLRNAGISGAGIDFVSRLLHRDPQSRPKERECLQHPWIADVADVDEYEDDALQSDREELSAIGEDSAEELDASQISLNDSDADDSGDMDDLTYSKRQRVESPPKEIHYPSLPKFESIQESHRSYRPSPRRLFGEITPSILRSSNVLGAEAPVFEGDDFSFPDFLSSTGESMVSEGNSMNSVLSLPENPFGGSAPSLMGAENLVGQLNMNSTWHPGTPNRPLTVETPPRQPSPGYQKTTGSNGAETKEPSINATPKASKFNRRIDIPMPGIAKENSNGKSNDTKNSRPGDIQMGPGQEFDIELAATLDARTGAEIPELPLRMDRDTSSESSRGRNIAIQQDASNPQPSKLGPLLGKLTSLPRSIANLTIPLEGRMTSWGRGRLTTVRYLDGMDSRIPKYALEITFWAPGIEKKIQAGEDWLKVPGVIAILSTKTREHIWVNDTKLCRGSQGTNGGAEVHFGKLYSGDIVTVYRDPDQFLKFKCEFYHGESARPRPEKEKPFIVQKQWVPTLPPSKGSSEGEDSERSGKSGKSGK